ncbi:MAG: hypothetical protein ABGW77_02355 [Campylobacterales bacterium]
MGGQQDWEFNIVVVVGAILALWGVVWGLITPREAGLILIGSMVGGILPDLDSGQSASVKLMEYTAIALFSYFVFSKMWGDISYLMFSLIFIGGLLMILLFFFIIDMLVEPYGVFHSIPFAVLVGLLGVEIGYYFFRLNIQLSAVLGVAVFLGYLVHLIVDEVLGFAGGEKRLRALKFWGKSLFSTVAVYFLIGLLILLLPEREQLLQLIQ